MLIVADVKEKSSMWYDTHMDDRGTHIELVLAEWNWHISGKGGGPR